jgi:hypothetical protein
VASPAVPIQVTSYLFAVLRRLDMDPVSHHHDTGSEVIVEIRSLGWVAVADSEEYVINQHNQKDR